MSPSPNIMSLSSRSWQTQSNLMLPSAWVFSLEFADTLISSLLLNVFLQPLTWHSAAFYCIVNCDGHSIHYVTDVELILLLIYFLRCTITGNWQVDNFYSVNCPTVALIV